MKLSPVSISAEANAPSKEDLVGLIDFELEREGKRSSRPGWNAWLILGALSTIIWLGLEKFSIEEITSTEVILIFIALTLTYEGGKSFFNLLNLTSSTIAQSEKFILANTALSAIRRILAFQLLIEIAIWLFVKNHQQDVSFNTYWAILILYGAHVFLTIISLATSYAELPIPKSSISISGWKILVVLLLTVTEISAAAGLMLPYIENQLPLTKNELQLAVLLFISCQLILLYFRFQQHENPLAETLHQIRQALALNKIDLATAKIQIETALDGLTVSEVLQGNIEAVLAPLRNVSLSHQNIIQSTEALFAALKNEDLTFDHREKLLAMASSSQEQTTINVHSQLDLAKKAVSKLERKLKLLYALHKESEPEISKTVEKLKANVNKGNEECKNQLAQWKDMWNAIAAMEIERAETGPRDSTG